MSELLQNNDFHKFIVNLKERIRSAQLSAMRAVNKELISLYWDIGQHIIEEQTEKEWGSGVVELIAKELQIEFTGIQGFSERNLWRMRNFYVIYKDNAILTQLVAEIGWSHNMVILEKCRDNLEREFYIKMTRKFGWSRAVLIHHLEGKSYEKFLLNQTNFDQTLPEKYKNQAILAVRDEYNFDFLELSEEHSEKELESGLIGNIRKFLAEMGHNFCFIGTQYRLEIEDDEFFIDLLLYHRGLKSLIAVELKTTKFKSEYIGKMGLYLSALDDLVRVAGENPSIGIIICKDKNRTVVEYALRDSNKPIGVATYKAGDKMPENIQAQLPSVDQITEYLQKLHE